jgi:hypothetical protein
MPELRHLRAVAEDVAAVDRAALGRDLAERLIDLTGASESANDTTQAGAGLRATSRRAASTGSPPVFAPPSVSTITAVLPLSSLTAG